MWTGTKDNHGYGKISAGVGITPFKAHRISWEMRYGPILKGNVICHKCDTPACVNPSHLFSGTQKDNMQDCSNKGRLSKISLENLSHDKSLSNSDVNKILEIKFKAKNGKGEGLALSDVAKEYNVCINTISKVINKRY